MPLIETALVGGHIAFRQHSAGHTAGPNWPGVRRPLPQSPSGYSDSVTKVPINELRLSGLLQVVPSPSPSHWFATE